jgi:hypothetical protein
MAKLKTWAQRIWFFIIGGAPRQEVRSIKPQKPEGRSKDVEQAGRWYFKRNILDQLGAYGKAVRTMKKADPESYKLYTKVGAVIVNPKIGMLSRGNEDASHLSSDPQRVAFGAVTFMLPTEAQIEAAHKREKFLPAFLYFTRLDTPPPSVQAAPPGAVVYDMTVFFYIFHHKDNKIKKTFGAPVRYYLAVDKKAHVVVLRQKVIDRRTVKCRTKQPMPGAAPRPPGGRITLTTTSWGLPRELVELWKDPGHTESLKEWSLNDYGGWLFRIAYDAFVSSVSDIRIGCRRGGVTAAFSVDLLRTPYFFYDRDRTQIAADGKRKRIFHIVRTHKRVLETGKETSVKSHFRGVRSFMWNGYAVHITMPGKHHASLTDTNFGGHHIEEGDPIPPDMRDHAWVGERLEEEFAA